ncbi:hypothetical protein BHYA_0245g00080 [Botrytis hyacinthi]|uniref:Uncharacterized protein n=1 Tax=Botrytis hyacinthi TaxID=278943 RepID=A0A4Z1G9E0_9HELO|nr:hypothetical protein BHYA_0245g00080 [Botrytis hyacinthi]
MVLPTERDRELWRKAIQTPEAITDEERRIILGLVDSATQLSNCLRISGMTPDDLERKALAEPAFLTQDECRLIQYGYHDWDPSEYLDNRKLSDDWNPEDKKAQTSARVALKTRNDKAVLLASVRRLAEFADQESEDFKNTMKEVAEGTGKPCSWVKRLMNSESTTTGVGLQSKWGFVILRDCRTECSDEDWEKFLRNFEKHVNWSLFLLNGGDVLNKTRTLIWGGGLVDGYDRESLYRAFKEVLPTENEANRNVLRNTFLLVTSEVLASFTSSASTSWIWAYDVTFDLATTLGTCLNAEYDGRMRVKFTSLFTWFYAARKERIHNMELFWEKAQQQPSKAWDVNTIYGRYHGPFILLKKGVLRPINSYELKN